MNPVLEKILETQEVESLTGEKIPLRVAVNRDEGELLGRIISSDAGVFRTLEVGCAYGISSLFILNALELREQGNHTIIDPFQYETWNGIGLENIKRAGYTNYTHLQERSEFILPELVKNGEKFDFIFIDGFHTFDHTLIDCFYATRLLKVGGYLAVDDVDLPPVRKVVDYLKLYPCYKVKEESTYTTKKSASKKVLLGLIHTIPERTRKRLINKSAMNDLSERNTSLTVLKKVAEDERGWDWFDSSF